MPQNLFFPLPLKKSFCTSSKLVCFYCDLAINRCAAGLYVCLMHRMNRINIASVGWGILVIYVYIFYMLLLST